MEIGTIIGLVALAPIVIVAWLAAANISVILYKALRTNSTKEEKKMN